MYRKYFVWSFDDGLEQDKRIIRILKQYGMGATFNLNSGMYGEKTWEGRIGNLGIKEVPYDTFDPHKRHLLKYAPHFRIPAEEVREVYAGYEIASHTLNHKNLKKCSEEELRHQILEDVKNLEQTFGQQITGFAYPYGMSSDTCVPVLKEAGIRYARTVGSTHDFRFPEDPYHLPMTCWHISKKVFSELERFYEAKAEEDDLLFLMFAHGYEFDFGTKESNWYKFDRICRSVAEHSDIICCSTADAFAAHEGDRS